MILILTRSKEWVLALSGWGGVEWGGVRWGGVEWGGVGWGGGGVEWWGGVGWVGGGGVEWGWGGWVGGGGVQTFKHTKSPHKHMAPVTKTTDVPSPQQRIQEHINSALVYTLSAKRANLQATKILTGDWD